MTVHSRALLIGCIDMLSPRIEEAKASGELRADVPTPVVAEMFARFLFSLVTTPAANLDTSDPAVVRELIAENLFKGWT